MSTNKFKQDLSMERIKKMQDFVETFGFNENDDENNCEDELTKGFNETQLRIYKLVCLEIFSNRKEDDNLECERINNILEDLFNTYQAVYFYLNMLCMSKKAIKIPIKLLEVKYKSTKSFFVDLERIINNFKEKNVSKEIKRLKSLLELFPKLDGLIRRLFFKIEK